MELNTECIHDIVHPTAAFCLGEPRGIFPDVDGEVPWEESQLNPKNRIDSLDIPENPHWEIDGCMGLGTQYFARPLNQGELPPMRIDVFIPEEATAELPQLRELLDLGDAFHTRDGRRTRRLGIARHIVRTLTAWTKAGGKGSPKAVAEMYKSLPYGSRIIFENMDANIHNIKIAVAPTHDVERQLLSSSKLATLYKMEPEALPKAVDIYQLRVIHYLQDSVCLVRVSRGGGYDGDPDQVWILKALTSDFKYLYTELRNLLRMEPHPHVMSRPKYLVSKLCKFGNKEGIVGFLLEYHSGGGLRDQIPLLHIHNQLTPQLQTKWALQLTSAVLHVRERCKVFYPDLRLDNVVLSKSNDIVMVDFEQRGVWCEFAAPEVNAIEYIRILATDGGGQADDNAAAGCSVIPEFVREQYAAVLDEILPDWDTVMDSEEYGPLPHGYDSYNIPWLALSAREQEAAEVYMLGRCLWCIFEGQCAPQPSAVWQSYRREPDIEFPNFCHTPPEMRALIKFCTRGRRGALSQHIVRRGGKLVLRRKAGGGDDGEANGPGSVAGTSSSATAVFVAARDWWKDELREAENFLEMREERKGRRAWDENYFQRPSLREVLAALRNFSVTIGLDAQDVIPEG